MKNIYLTLAILFSLFTSACDNTINTDETSDTEASHDIELASSDEGAPQIVNGIKEGTTSLETRDDVDLDTIPDETDNCPTVQNTDQTDSDANGIGDACQD